MKATLFLITMICLVSFLGAQHTEFKFSITLIGKNGSTLSGIKIWMDNKSTGEVITKRTGSNGIAKFTLSQGFWTVNLPGLSDYREIEVEEGMIGNGSSTLSYDYEEISTQQKIIRARQKMLFAEVDQIGMKITKSSPGFCILRVILEDKSKSPVKDLPVELVSIKQEKKYKSKTDKEGIAKFLVPIGETYAVDVDGIKNFSFSGKVFRQGILTLENIYEPTDIVEHNHNDTITQVLPEDVKATSARLHMIMTVYDEYQQPVMDEIVYMQQLITNKVFKTRTNDEGQAVFLLPKGERYMLHFDYQKDVDVFNYSKVHGLGNARANVVYKPDPKLKYPEKYIPKPDELFLKEFENFITKALSEPEENKKVDIFFKWGNGKVNSESKEAILEIGVSGSNDENKFESTQNVDLAFVLDKSGSMAGYERIESVKASMVKFIDKLRPDDCVSLISFNTNAFVEIPIKRKGTGTYLKDAINEIEPDGGTNIYNGMILGYEQLLKSRHTDRIKQLILLTDGYGETEPKIVVEKSKEYNDKGLEISAIGVGEDYNYALLELLTQGQVGMMTHVGKSEDIYTAFEKQLSYLVFPIAKDAKLEIVFNSNIQFSKLFGVKMQSEQSDRIIVDLGTLYMGYNKVALVQFDLKKPDKSIEKEPVRLILSYKDAETDKVEKIDKKAALTWEPATGKLELFIEQEQKKLYTIAILNQSVKKMVDAFAAEDFPKAKHTLQRAFQQLEELYPELSDPDIEKLVATMTNYAKAIDNTLKKKKLEEKK